MSAETRLITNKDRKISMPEIARPVAVVCEAKKAEVTTESPVTKATQRIENMLNNRGVMPTLKLMAERYECESVLETNPQDTEATKRILSLDRSFNMKVNPVEASADPYSGLHMKAARSAAEKLYEANSEENSPARTTAKELREIIARDNERRAKYEPKRPIKDGTIEEFTTKWTTIFSRSK